MKVPLKRRPSGNCKFCGVFRHSLHRDHIIPKFKGGSDDPSNWQYICANCHEDKSREERKGHSPVIPLNSSHRGPDQKPRKVPIRSKEASAKQAAKLRGRKLPQWHCDKIRRGRIRFWSRQRAVLYDPVLFKENPSLLALEESER